MRHKRKSPLSADFSFGEYSTSLNTCEDSADSPYVIQRAVMQAMDEEFYHKSHYYLPRRGSSRSIARLLCLWDSVIGPSEPR